MLQKVLWTSLPRRPTPLQPLRHTECPGQRRPASARPFSSGGRIFGLPHSLSGLAHLTPTMVIPAILAVIAMHVDANVPTGWVDDRIDVVTRSVLFMIQENVGVAKARRIAATARRSRRRLRRRLLMRRRRACRTSAACQISQTFYGFRGQAAEPRQLAALILSSCAELLDFLAQSHSLAL